MRRITITLTKDESIALQELAGIERRHPRMQAAVLVRRQLEQIGLIPDTIKLSIRASDNLDLPCVSNDS